jgi:hypothetical protein
LLRLVPSAPPNCRSSPSPRRAKASCCSLAEFERFIDGSRPHAVGWLGFYWGKPPAELKRSGQLRDALLLGWLEFFQRKGKEMSQRR